MNRSMIRYVFGSILLLEGVLLLLPVIISFIYREREGIVYLAVGMTSISFGLFLRAFKFKNKNFFTKDGFVCVTLCWLALSLVGALPFVITHEIPSYVDAVFETISGFSTTGATILTDVEALSKTSSFWRVFTHWIGGMGVLVFIIAIMPLSGNSSMYLYQAESPGPSAGKLVPRMRQTAFLLYAIYFGITMAEFAALLIAGLNPYEAICTTVATVGTGGFGIYNSSIGGFSPAVQVIVGIFMVLCAVNFNFYYYIIFKKFKDALSMEEVHFFLASVVVITAIITVNIRNMYSGTFEAARHAFFQVASLISSTGFSTVNYDLWPELSKTLILCIMFIGACAGSTGGGLKVSRFLIAIKSVLNEVELIAHPHGVRRVRMNKKVVADNVVRTSMGYMAVFVCILVGSTLLLSIDGFSFTTNFTAVLSCMNNMGPGLEMVGPAGNYSEFSDFSKIVMIFDMLAGRLEIFPVLIMFSPSLWRIKSPFRKKIRDIK